MGVSIYFSDPEKRRIEVRYYDKSAGVLTRLSVIIVEGYEE